MEAVRALVEQDPANSRIRFMLAMEYMGASEWRLALGELDELIRRDSGYVAAYYQAGRASEELRELEPAKRYYQAGVEAARRAGDGHALSEMQAALDILG